MSYTVKFMSPTHIKEAPKSDGLISALARDERGATAVEYALILAAIAAVIMLIVMALGSTVFDLFASVNDPFPEP